MEELLALLGLGGGGLLVGEAYSQLGDIGDKAWTESQRIGQSAADMSNFTGYGVTGPTGNANVSGDGSLSLGLSPEQQAYQNRAQQAAYGTLGWDNPLSTYGAGALNTAQSMLGEIGQGTGAREQDIYDRIRAMQMPEEERQRLNLESRLAAQGRTGVQTAAYGGTPEQLALSKAQEEAQNAASYEAIKLAMQQQAQQGQLAGGLAQSGAGALGTQGDLSRTYGALQYAPQSALLDLLQGGNQSYQFEDIARRQAAQQYAQANMGGLEGLLGASLGQANLMGQLGTGAIQGGFGMLSSAINNGGGSGSLWDFIKKAGGSIF